MALQVMKEGAKYVAIVREAASHYESLWGYNGYEKVSSKTRAGLLLSGGHIP